MKRLLKIGRMDSSVYPGDDSSLYDSSYKRHSCENHMHKKVRVIFHLVFIRRLFGIHLVFISCPFLTISYILYYIAIIFYCYVTKYCYYVMWRHNSRPMLIENNYFRIPRKQDWNRTNKKLWITLKSIRIDWKNSWRKFGNIMIQKLNSLREIFI